MELEQKRSRTEGPFGYKVLLDSILALSSRFAKKSIVILSIL